MPAFLKYEDSGRTLFVRFKCSRCSFENYEELEKCDKRTGDRGDYLHQLSLPEGWSENRFSSIILCPKCNKDFDNFMKLGKTNFNSKE